MKNKIVLTYVLSACLAIITGLSAQTTISVFNNVLFYDGYNSNVFDASLKDSVIRFRNDLYSKKLTDEQLTDFGSEITMNVTVKASCDNYDRIGNVNLALVPKGAISYNINEVKRIEIGRFITPFMNKNKTPNTVPYSYKVDYLRHIFKDKSLQSQYDFWIELELFGVPYAANTEVSGCSGRNDVFYGSVNFVSSGSAVAEEDNTVLIPLSIKHDFNNYTANATDEIGKTIKSTDFWVSSDLSDAQLVLITSNHGANSGGEEYIRRMHYAYFDGENVLSYKPGRESCEPFRKYNTQGNGIYGNYSRSNAQWQSFSNWCPGDVIDNRIISLGSVPVGNHTFKIEVPDATFASGQGNFPLSLYLIGKTRGSLSALGENPYEDLSVYPNPVQSELTINSYEPIESICIYTITGQKVYQGNNHRIDMTNLATGIYSVSVKFINGKRNAYKISKK